jgi:hypothetical protein
MNAGEDWVWRGRRDALGWLRRPRVTLLIEAFTAEANVMSLQPLVNHPKMIRRLATISGWRLQERVNATCSSSPIDSTTSVREWECR